MVLLFLGLLFLPSTSQGSFHSPAFQGAPQSIATGDGAYEMIVRDFNNDGHKDVLVLPSRGESIYLHLGDGNGSFHDPIISLYSPAEREGERQVEPSDGLVHDFNGDGQLDLVVFHFSKRLDLVLGVQDGIFRFRNTLAHLVSPSNPVLGNFNGDSYLDVVMVDQASDSPSVLILPGEMAGLGRAEFIPVVGKNLKETFTTVMDTIAKFDVDQDGLDDIIGTTDNHFVVLKNEGHQFSIYQKPLPVLQAPMNLTVGGIDQNGKAMAIVGHAWSWLVLVFEYHLDSKRFEDNDASFEIPPFFSHVVLADVDENGVEDLVGVNFDPGDIVYRAGLGSFQFEEQNSADLIGVDIGTKVVVEDMNHDDKPDILVLDIQKDQFSIYLQ